MGKYTLSSYEPVVVKLPLPQVPDKLIDQHIQKLLDPLATFTEVTEIRPCKMGDYLVVSTTEATIDDNPAPHLNMEHSLYHLGSGEMPKQLDKEVDGMKVGETRELAAMVRTPVGKLGGVSVLFMKMTVEKMLTAVKPELTDELVAEHFAPSTTIAELRAEVAKKFTLPDMRKDDERFLDLVMHGLAERLVEEPDEADRMPGMPDDALRITCAIDALFDHLDLDLTDDEITDLLPGETKEKKEEFRQELEDQGLGDQVLVYAHREAGLQWLEEFSRVTYKD